MELLNNPQIHSTFASLGRMQNETYFVNDNCMEILEEINCKLSMEDHTLRTYRRAIGFGQNIKKDMIPFLINVRDPKVLDCALRLMVNLTVPIECLLSVGIMSRTEVGRHTIYELNRLLFTSKEAFVDLKATKAIIDHMKNILDSDKLSINQCETINNCLLLLRNILHIPENVQQQQSHTPMQNQILWNLFTQSIDKLLIHLMSCPQKAFWGVTIVQLIALMYKDQHVGTLQKLLNHWFEAASHTESSENESNTSPPKQSSGDSSPMLTSDPTSDSSDNCSGSMTKIEGEDTRNSEFQTNLVRVKPKPTSQDSVDSANSSEIAEFYNSQDIIMKSPESTSPTPLSRTQEWAQKSNTQMHGNMKSIRQSPNNQSSEVSDCGYGTQASQGDNQEIRTVENVSASSSDDDIPKQKPAHQRPPTTNQKQRFNAEQKHAKQAKISVTVQDKSDARRKKLVKRSKSSIINMKGMIQHTPTDEDISNILKEFTVDFLLKGYGSLVQDLHEKLLTDSQLSIDTSHFFWLVTYFLKFAAQLELDMEHIESVLNFDIIGYLTFQGVHLCEHFELSLRQQGTDLKPVLRRIHLVVTAIREFLQALEIYKKSSHLTVEDKKRIYALEMQICCTEDLRNLFVLLMRCYNPLSQSRQYLQDLVVTNHILLTLLDKVSKEPKTKCNVNMNEHLQQFATVEIMQHYGTLLENFRENGDFVNDCIFTMLHHIGGDLNQVTILFQPKILKTFSKLWENECEICDDWSDLIEYVIYKFINTPAKPPIALASPMSNTVSISDVWAQEEMDTLYWYYVQSKKSPDVVGNIIKQIKDSGNKLKSRIAVIQQLLQQDIVTLVEFNDLMKFEDSQYKREAKFFDSDDTDMKSDSGLQASESSEMSVQVDNIKLLRDRLLKEKKGNSVLWLQKILIECCYIKLTLANPNKDEVSTAFMEPIPLHCILNKQSVPLVPFNDEQNKILVYQPFVLLLHKLGFHLPADDNKLFVRIPEFWTAKTLFSIAEKLGPIPKKFLKFNLKLIRKSESVVAMTVDTDLTHSLAFKNDALFISPTSSADCDLRCTPESTPSSSKLSSQNWMQIVMQSKSSERSIVESSPPPLTIQTEPVGHAFLQPSAPLRNATTNISSGLIMIAKTGKVE